jgi:hypothetical protein
MVIWTDRKLKVLNEAEFISEPKSGELRANGFFCIDQCDALAAS